MEDQNFSINFGSAVKVLPNGHIGGHLVRFTTKTKPDLAGDYFDASTDFGFDGRAEIKSPVFLNHRLPLETPDGKEVVVKTKIGEATLKMGDDGVLIDAILYERKKYKKALAEMGFSSGTAAHLIDRERKGSANYIKTWPLGLDASITPTPCDPDNICSLKSFGEALKTAGVKTSLEPIDEPAGEPSDAKRVTLAARLTRYIEDLADDGRDHDSVIKQLAREAMCEPADVETVLDGTRRRPSNAHLKAFARVLGVPYDMLRSIAERQRPDPKSLKSAFDDMVAEEMAEGPCAWQLWSIYGKLIKDVATMAKASQTTGTPFDLNSKVREAAQAFAAHLEPSTIAQIGDWLEPDDNEEYSPDDFYLKALVNPSADHLISGKHLSIEDHCSMAVSAFKSVVARFVLNNDMRVKAGRELSNKNRSELQKLKDAADALVSGIDALLEATKPVATDEAMRAARTRHLALRTQRRAHHIGA